MRKETNMRKKLTALAIVVGVLAAASIASAQVFDEDTGTATIMASGGTVYEDHTTSAQAVSSGTTIATVTLPAGRYEVSGKTWLGNGTGSANFAQCGLTNLAISENARATLPASGYSTLAVLGTVEFSEETAIVFSCSVDASATANYTVLTATTVSAIVSQ